MKLFIFILNIVIAQAALAQGTIFFSASLYGTVPESEPLVPYLAGHGSFTLTPDGLFSGTAQFDIQFGLRGVHITDRNQNIIRSASRFADISEPDSGVPGAYILATWDPLALSPDETSKLLAGELYVHAPSGLRPGTGDVFGQITLVPEPGVWCLLLVGGPVLYVLRNSKGPKGSGTY